MFYDPSSTPAGTCDSLHAIPADCMSAPWPLAIGVALLIIVILAHELGKDFIARRRKRKGSGS